jgi:hypothetical protein
MQNILEDTFYKKFEKHFPNFFHAKGVKKKRDDGKRNAHKMLYWAYLCSFGPVSITSPYKFTFSPKVPIKIL